MGVQTGTICPFPWAAANISEVPTSLAQCTQTYAEALGDIYQIVRGIVFAAAIFGSLAMMYRIYRFRIYTRRLQIDMWQHPMFRMIIFGLLFNLVVIIETVDMFAFNGYYPAELYVVLDEIAPSLALSNAVFTVDLYHQLTKALKDFDRRRARVVRNITLVAIWTNFLGFITLGVTDTPRYHLYEGLKSLGGGIILLVFIVLSTLYVRQLYNVLKLGMEINANKKRAEAQLIRLKSKHTRFVLVVGLGAIALIANAIVALTATDYSWTLRIQDLPDIAQIVLRFVYVAYIGLQLYLFRVPSVESGSSSNAGGTVDSKSGDKVGNQHDFSGAYGESQFGPTMSSPTATVSYSSPVGTAHNQIVPTSTADES